MKSLAVLLLFVSLSACSLLEQRPPTTIKALLPVGSTLRLTQPLEIPAEKRYVYLQYGKIASFKAYNSVDIYYPYCQFYLHESSLQARRVKPDRFLVTKVVEWEDYLGEAKQNRLARAQTPDKARVQLAAAGFSGGLRLGLGGEDDAGPSMIMYATIISLQSEQQPQVKELVCGHWDDQGTVEPLTLEEMKSALGEVIIVE